MKLTKYFVSALMLLALVGCDDKSDLGVMQVSGQMPVLSPESTLTLSPAGGLLTIGGPASFILGDHDTFPIVRYAYGDSVMPDAVPSVVMEVASAQDFSNAISIPLTLKEGTDEFYVGSADWDNAFRRLFGKAPAAKTNYIRFAAYLSFNQGAQVSRIGDEDTWFVSTSVSITPVDLGIHVEEAYYLVGTVCGWDLAQAVKFEHSDRNVYDDPVFTLAINVSADQAEGGWWWKIVPESSFLAQDWGGLYGVEIDGDTSLSGNLYAGGNAGQLKSAGQQLFTIDMLSCTYTVSNAIPALYTPGSSNGWNPAGSSTLTTSDFTNYSGFLYLNGEWLITPEPNWDNKYGAADEPGTLVAGGGNLSLPAAGAGLYWTQVNLGSLTYSTDLISTFGLIGDFNGWAGDVAMTPGDDFLTWTAEMTFESAGGWKIRANNDWAVNLGGDPSDLTPGGANIDAPEPGTYTVTLDLRNHPYTVTLTK